MCMSNACEALIHGLRRALHAVRSAAIPIILYVAAPLTRRVRRIIRLPLSLLPFTSETFGPPRGSCASLSEWINAHKGEGSYRPVHPSTRVTQRLPISIEDRVHWKFRQEAEVTFPPTFVAEIPGGRALLKDGTVIAPRDMVLADVSQRFGTPGHDHPVLCRLTLPRCLSVDAAVAVIARQGQDNYYHWLVDVLPRLALVWSGDVVVDRYAINAALPFQAETLRILGIPRERVISAQNAGQVKARTLVVPSLTGHAAPWVCRFLRDKLMRGMPAPKGLPSKLYLARGTRGRRRVTNERQLLDFLARDGFEVVDCGRMSVVEQINAFAAADIVIAPHGAALSNLVFCKPRTKVVEFFSPKYVNVCFWAIANQVGLQYAYLLGAGRRPRALKDPHDLFDDIVVDIEQLRSLLRKMDR